MSLVGNLEDLGLGDILQIVSLSQKSGVLTLKCDDCVGEIYFTRGKVIRASCSDMPLNLGDLLVRQGLVSLDVVTRALIQQRSEGGYRCIGTVLTEDHGIEAEQIEATVKRQIETLVFSFFSWEKGSFAFEIGEQRVLGDAALDPLSFLYAKGLNPQWLALEGSKILDEGGMPQVTQQLVAETQSPPVTDWDQLLNVNHHQSNTPDLQPHRLEQPFLILDDDPATRASFEKFLLDRGETVHLFSETAPLVQACLQLNNRGVRPVVLIDLVMPRQDGQGVLGGLEAIEAVTPVCPEADLFLMSDHLNAASSEQLAPYGLSTVLSKPKKQQILEQRSRACLNELYQQIVQRLMPPQPKQAEPPVDIVTELMDELDGEVGESVITPSCDVGRDMPGLNLLKGLLQELATLEPGGEVILLILRFASEMMSRAMILGYRDGIFSDVGQFGFDLSRYPQGVRLQPEDVQNSPLATILRKPVPVTFDDKVSLPWIGRFGGKAPTEVFMAPVLSKGKVVAVLYGDNAPERQSIGDTTPLEIFLSQAGLAMERILDQKGLGGASSNVVSMH